MRILGRFVIMLAVLSFCATVSASKKYPFFLSAQLEAAHDSNVSGLDESVSGVGTAGRMDLSIDAEIARRWHRKNDLIAEVAGGVAGWKSEIDRSEFELDTVQWHLRFDADLPKEMAESIGLERLTFGAQYENWSSHLGGRSWADSQTVTAAVQGAWNATNLCNLDNFLLYYEYEDFEDGPIFDPFLSRTGEHRSVGAEVNLYRYGTASKKNCRRPGILRRYVPAGAKTLNFGYRSDDVNAVGEYEARWHQIYFDGRIPIQKDRKKRPLASLDLSAGLARVEYENPSIFAPFVAREDTPSFMEAAFVKHLKKFDFRVGLRSETNASSDIVRYRVDREVFFFGLKFEKYNERARGTGGGSTGSSGSSSDRRTGQSGSSGGIDPELNP